MRAHTPTDILDEIFQHIERPKDLLSLALTCCRLRDTVIPRHIEFRDISCDPHRISLWQRLADRPRLAAKFRTLVLYPEFLPEPKRGPPIVPRSLEELGSEGTSEMSLHALKEAVKHMSDLKVFVWDYKGLGRYRPALGSVSKGTLLLLRDVFEIIAENCPQLKEVDVTLCDNPFLDISVRAVRISLPLGKLSGLTRFSFAISNCTNPMISVTHIFQLLTERCPDLVELKLKVHWGTWYSVTKLLEKGHWPHLRKLTLDGLDRNSQMFDLDLDNRALLMATFLERHPKLEHLSLASPGMLVRHGIFEGTLPRLRSLRYSELRYIVPNELIMPSSLLERLEYFSPPRITGKYPVDPLRTSMRGLASRIEDSQVPIVVSMFPKLERLEFLYPGPHDLDETEDLWLRDRIEEDDPRIETLSKLERLTYLAGYLFSATHASPDALTAKLSKLSAVPSLRYVQYQVGYRRRECKWIFIERDKDGTYTGFRYVAPSGNMEPQYWGDFFERIG